MNKGMRCPLCGEVEPCKYDFPSHFHCMVCGLAFALWDQVSALVKIQQAVLEARSIEAVYTAQRLAEHYQEKYNPQAIDNR